MQWLQYAIMLNKGDETSVFPCSWFLEKSFHSFIIKYDINGFVDGIYQSESTNF